MLIIHLQNRRKGFLATLNSWGMVAQRRSCRGQSVRDDPGQLLQGPVVTRARELVQFTEIRGTDRFPSQTRLQPCKTRPPAAGSAAKNTPRPGSSRGTPGVVVLGRPARPPRPGRKTPTPRRPRAPRSAPRLRFKGA